MKSLMTGLYANRFLIWRPVFVLNDNFIWPQMVSDASSSKAVVLMLLIDC